MRLITCRTSNPLRRGEDADILFHGFQMEKPEVQFTERVCDFKQASTSIYSRHAGLEPVSSLIERKVLQ